MNYTLHFDAQRARKPLTCKSMAEVLRTARAILGVQRIYKGAQYAHEDGGTALDLWVRAKDARQQMGVPANCVVICQ